MATNQSMETGLSNTKQYSIGVVTYHARFDEYFKPLIKKMAKVFPDREIICVLNGHPNQDLQLRYIKRATELLSQYPNIRYITYLDNQSLSRCWNQIIILSTTDNVLILNDDTQLSELFRTELEPHVGTHPITTFNHSWSHFLIRKDIVRQVGWFDERFPGVGCEDGDYAYRMAMKNIALHNVSVDGIRNFVAKNVDPGWKLLSKTTKGKYTEANQEFFDRKWKNMENSPETHTFTHISDFSGTTTPFTPVAGMETPLFYEFSLLESTSRIEKDIRVDFSQTRLQLSRLYFKAGRRIKRTVILIRNLFT